MPDLSNMTLQTNPNSSSVYQILESDFNLNEFRFSAPSNPLYLYLSYEQDASVPSLQRENLVTYSGTKLGTDNSGVIPHFYLSQLTRFAEPRLKERVWFTLNQICNHRKKTKTQQTYLDIGINRLCASYTSEDPSLLVDTIIGDLQPLVSFTKAFLLSIKNDVAANAMAMGNREILDILQVYLKNHRMYEKKTTYTKLSNAPMKVVQDYVKYSILKVLSATLG
ncbi:BA75_01120T0 [Komagataella pastoris]|uniref:BA75_01120T0 n=1 Tax=Komagataella pastoris TaxID=4922 RepID=A0A1B2J5D8_PICPA|nr:BA75_01120T0 [Komagataella pastoris]